MRLSLLLLIAPLALHAQSNFLIFGGGYSPGTSPKAATTMAFGTLINTANKIYSYSAYSATFYKGKPTTSLQTGIATPLRCIKAFCLDGLGTGGVSSGAATTGAISLGGAATYQHGHFLVVAPFLWTKTGTVSNPTYQMLAGVTW